VTCILVFDAFSGYEPVGRANEVIAFTQLVVDYSISCIRNYEWHLLWK